MADDFNITRLWPKVSPAMKRRWWAETDYGKLPPSDDLKKAILAEMVPQSSEASRP